MELQDGAENRRRNSESNWWARVAARDWAELTRTYRITPLQLQVARRLLRGKTVDAIACELGRSARTIKDRVRSLYAKFLARNRIGFCMAVRDAIERSSRRVETR